MLLQRRKTKDFSEGSIGIFLEAFSLPTLEETKLIIEKLTSLVEKVNDTDLDSNVKLLEGFERKFQKKG